MPEAVTQLMQRNLQALIGTDRLLAERVCGPVGDEHVREEDDGSISYRLHRSWLSLALSAAEIESALQDVGDDRDVLVIGTGMGELIAALLALPTVDRVTTWDSDPYLLRLLLGRVDHSQDLATGRLKLSLCADLLDEVKEGQAGRAVVFHPFLAPVYSNEARLVIEGVGERTALVCEGTLFVDDLAQALRQEGLSVASWPLTRLCPEELMRIARGFRPEFVASINYFHGLAEACSDAGLPLISWEIDPSTDRLENTSSSGSAHVFTYRKAHVELFRNAGFADVQYLPLAANPDKRKPVTLSAAEQEHYGADVAFVGNSMVSQGQLFHETLCARYTAWKGGDAAAAQAEIEEQLALLLGAQAQDHSRYSLPQLFEQSLPDFLAAMRSQDGVDPITLVAEMAAADKRIVYVSNLGQVSIKVWGDDGWRHTADHGAVYMGPAGHHEELTKIYSSTGINIDIGRLYQSDIVTMRVFDVMACGGFLLAEHSDALVELFEPGVHLDCYRNLEELLEKVEYYLEHKDEASTIARTGMEAVRSDHTIRQRVQHMLRSSGIPVGTGEAPAAG